MPSSALLLLTRLSSPLSSIADTSFDRGFHFKVLLRHRCLRLRSPSLSSSSFSTWFDSSISGWRLAVHVDLAVLLGIGDYVCPNVCNSPAHLLLLFSKSHPMFQQFRYQSRHSNGSAFPVCGRNIIAPHPTPSVSLQLSQPRISIIYILL